MPGNHQIEGNKYIHNDDYHYQPNKPCNRWDLLVTLNEYDELWIILMNITSLLNSFETFDDLVIFFG